jgi:hypothetical protein
MRRWLSKDFVLSRKHALRYRVYKEYVKIKLRYFKSTFWVIILCNLERAWCFGEHITSIFKVKEQVKQETSRGQKTCFLPSLLFGPEDGGLCGVTPQKTLFFSLKHEDLKPKIIHLPSILFDSRFSDCCVSQCYSLNKTG